MIEKSPNLRESSRKKIERIFQAFYELINEKGYNDTTIRDIKTSDNIIHREK